MSARQTKRHNDGFTLVEMLVSLGVIGLILTLIGMEFVGVVNHTLHTRADTDAESQTRLIMAKVSTQLRTSYFDLTDYPTVPNAQQVPVVSPLPAVSATPANFVVFYHVSKGGLGSPVPLCSPGSLDAGAPCPPFDLVTIQMSSTTPGELDEIITPQHTGVPSSPMPIGQNVTAFEVTPISDSEAKSGQYNIKITVTQPSQHCVANGCSFTLDNVVYVGGQQ